ncbi:Peptide deformylase [uncultured Paludibacter sp.]|uniref:Peptide deformylase n=1 Tax=uncultured Paludibacter sp. TaxID=497635 RepID=A0A653A607_9BACT|nr:Peptide deformylase [uncultured Paludibacter sp.]
MILPIYTYGNAVLRKIAEPIEADYPNLKELVQNMYETMTHAEGVGLAAPQIGLPIRVLVIDLAPFEESDPEIADFKIAMINPEIVEESEETVAYDEGCLSIPGINETVIRPESVVVNYFDEDFNEHEEEFDGFKARVIQHEIDHLEGHLFTDRINPLRRQLIKSKLTNITKGKADCKYKIK